MIKEAAITVRGRRLNVIQNYPVYSIGVVSELLDVHPETIRTWEKSGVVEPPQRRSGKRFYSERDYKRLQFIHKLIKEGLTLRALHYYLRLYPCWKTTDCPICLHNSDRTGSTKPCWQEEDTFCQAANSENPCTNCNSDVKQDSSETKESKPLRLVRRQDHQEVDNNLQFEANPETAKTNMP